MSKKNNNNNILFGVIIFLLIVIAVLAFFVGKNMGSTTVVNNNTTTSTELPDDFSIIVVDDKRCSDCQASQFITQLQQAPGLSTVDIEMVDFSDTGIAAMLEDEKITTLPAIIFSHNTGLDAGLTQYLQPLPSGKYTLSVGATFNPFAERSERGFLQLDEAAIAELTEGLNISGNSDAEITWLEYSDVNCHYCKKMETDGTAATVAETLGDDFNKAAITYISVGGQASQSAGEALTCIAQVAGSQAYNTAFSTTLSTGSNSISAILAAAEKEGVDTTAVQACIDNGDTKADIAKKIELQNKYFGQGGTPRNVILNTKTGEYEVLG